MASDSIRLSRGARSASLDDVLPLVLDAAVAALDAAVIVTDAMGRVELWNNAAEELYGWSAAEAIGAFLRDLIVPLAEHDQIDAIWTALADRGEWEGEFLSRSRDGVAVPVHVVDIPIRSEDGALRAIVGVSRYPRDPLVAEREWEALRALAEASLDAVFMVCEEEIISWTASAERTLGWPSAEVVGQSIWMLIVEDRVEEAREQLREVQRGQTVGSMLTERVARDGSRVPVSISVAPVFDITRRAWIGVVTLRDQRTLDEVVEAAVTAEARRRLFQAGTTEIVLVLDIHGKVKAVSAAAEKVLGLAPAELVGVEAMSLVHPDDAAEVKRAIDLVISGEDLHSEIIYRRLTADGSWRLAEATVSNMLADPTVAGIVVNIRDVSEREEARAFLAKREALFRSMFEQAADLAMVVTVDGTIIEVSPSSNLVLGLHPEALAGRLIGDVMGPAVADLLARNADPGNREQLTFELTFGARAPIWVEIELRNLASDPAVHGIVLNIRDVTARAVASQLLQNSQSQLSAVVNRSSDVAMFLDGDGMIRWVSPSVTLILGRNPKDLVDRSILEMVHPDDRARVVQALPDGFTKPGDHIHLSYRLHEETGEIRWVEVIATDLRADPNVGYIVANLRDVTASKADHDELERLALVDELTGLPNRHAMLTSLRRGLSHGPGERSCGFIFFDVDDFRDVNDSLGPAAGDLLLIAIARRVESALPPRCRLGRTGGDHFAIYCESVADLTECLAIVGMLHSSLVAPFVIDGQELFVVISVGIALSPTDQPDSLLRQADVALHRAKQSGRGQTVVFEPDFDHESRDRLIASGQLRRGIERSEIVPYYQPIVELATGRVLAVESLARWEHPERGLVAPDSFIPIAESTGLIGELGRQILERACWDAAQWLKDGRRIQVAVNASAIQLMDPSFPELVASILRAAALNPNQLSIEITETAALRDITAATRTLTALKEQGIEISLDDFGTGYSSLSFLKRLPVGGLKIDRSFVSGLGLVAEDDQIVAGVLGLALALGFYTVGEGVETELQADRLRALGCRFGQGFLWSPAVPANDLLTAIGRIESSSVPGAARDGGAPGL